MNTKEIERDFRTKVCEKIRLETEGTGRFRVFTPFMFEDGDHLAIVLKRYGEEWALSDEGHTYMHLTYDIDEKSLLNGSRAKVISAALTAFSVDDRGGELVMPIPDRAFGDALYSFVQAILRISDVTYLNKERVISTFLEDFRRFISEHVPEDRREFDWHDPVHDPTAKYTADCRIDHKEYPVLVYALPNDNKVRDAHIALATYENWYDRPPRSLGIFEDQESINRKVLARFSDVCDKQFSSLASNQERIERYFQDVLLIDQGSTGPRP